MSESEILGANDPSVTSSVDKSFRNGIHSKLKLPLYSLLVLRALVQAFQGKIVGRGVLLDYWSYAQSKGIAYAPETPTLVVAEDLEACARAQNVELRQGDILLIRMGYVQWYNNATLEQRVKGMSVPMVAVGIRQTEAEVEWLWFVKSFSSFPLFVAFFSNGRF